MSSNISAVGRIYGKDYAVTGATTACTLSSDTSLSTFEGVALCNHISTTSTPLSVVNRSGGGVFVGQDPDVMEGASSAYFGITGLASTLQIAASASTGTVGQILTANGDGSCSWAAPAFLARIEALEKKAGIASPVAEQVKEPVSVKQSLAQLKVRRPAVIKKSNEVVAPLAAPVTASNTRFISRRK